MRASTVVSRDLTADIARNEARWAELDAGHRATTRRAWAEAGWTICEHHLCPPWDCRWPYEHLCTVGKKQATVQLV